jgi:hypothetical protein
MHWINDDRKIHFRKWYLLPLEGRQGGEPPCHDGWEVGELAMSICSLKKKSEMEEKSKHVLFSWEMNQFQPASTLHVTNLSQVGYFFYNAQC